MSGTISAKKRLHGKSVRYQMLRRTSQFFWSATHPILWDSWSVSTDDPLGFDNPAEAVSELGQLRMTAGNHLKLYRAQAVTEPVVSHTDVEQYNADCMVEHFNFTLIQEHIK